MKDNYQGPLLSNEISSVDLGNQSKDDGYNKEVNQLFNEIVNDLRKLDSMGSGRITENDLIDYLSRKTPPNRPLNVVLFKQLFQDMVRNDDGTFDIEDFTKEYIQAHEELKLNFDTLFKGIDKEKRLKLELENRLMEAKQENIDKNGLCQDACVSTEIGKVTLLVAQPENLTIHCKVSLDGSNEKTTSEQAADNAVFKEKFKFPIESKGGILSYKLFLNGGTDYVGEAEIPLFGVVQENEEVTPEVEFKDVNGQSLASFKPKIIIVTSYYETYQKQYDNIDKNIESYQSRINQLKEALNDISAPYKKEFEESEKRLKNEEFGPLGGVVSGELVDNVEGVLKQTLGRHFSWPKIIQWLLYFCIGTTFITTFTKPDFFSLFVYLCLCIVVNNEGMNSYLFSHAKLWLIALLITVIYDIIDFLYLRSISIDFMASADGWVRFFGLFGFVGKCALVCGVYIVLGKYRKKRRLSD